MEKKELNINPLMLVAAIVANRILNNHGVFNEAPITEPETHDIGFFIQRIADKKGWKFEKTAGWLESIAEVSPIAAFNIVAREIAVFLDQKYEDHIENSEKIYIISTFDGVIHEACKKHIKNYRNFAAFRTIEDAKYCCNVMRDQLKGMFKSHAKK